MKAVKKPIPIDVQLFDPDAIPPSIPLNVTFRGDSGWQIWNPLHKSFINLKKGDYVNITNPEDTYPIEAEVFQNTYEVISE